MLEQFPVRAPNLELNPTDDGLIVLCAYEKRVSYLNPVASIILELCDGAHTPAMIADELAELFGADEPPLDLTIEGLEELAEDGLVGWPDRGDTAAGQT
jgi:hypothetical protein